MLEIYNNDTYGIEQFGAPEWLEFQDVYNNLSIEEMFPWLEEEEASEVEMLWQDIKRIQRQAEELNRLLPQKQHQTNADAKIMIEMHEKKIAKAVRHSIRIAPLEKEKQL